MKARLTIVVFAILCFSCKRDFEAPVPDLSWDRFESSSASPFGSSVGQKLEGVYTLSSGSEAFGSTAAAKWTYTANGSDTVFHLSFFVKRKSAILSWKESEKIPTSCSMDIGAKCKILKPGGPD